MVGNRKMSLIIILHTIFLDVNLKNVYPSNRYGVKAATLDTVKFKKMKTFILILLEYNKIQPNQSDYSNN